jgi:hypothetical protein
LPLLPARLSASLFVSRSTLFLAAAASLWATGCDDLKTQDTLRPSYERPKASPTPAGATGTPGATPDWSCNTRLREGTLTLSEASVELALTGKGLVQIADVGVLGGPFEPPLETAAPSSPAGAETAATGIVQLIVDKNGLAHCARLRFVRTPTPTNDAFPATATESRLGEVVIDSGTVVFADGARVATWLAHQPGDLFVGFEGPEAELPALAETLAKTIPTERILPTYFRATRPLLPTDLETAQRTIQTSNSHARAAVEPRPAAWPLVSTLGDQKLAGDAHAGEKSAALVDVPGGDGAYVVTTTKDESGALLGVTVSLER